MIRTTICSLLVAVLATTLPATAGPFAQAAPDAVDCRVNAKPGDAAATAQTVDTWIARRYTEVYPGKTTATTHAIDALVVDLTSSENFVDRVFGKGGALVLYDPGRHVLAYCRTMDTAQVLAVISGVPRPPFAVTQADLGAIRTARGIHIGSSVADVRHVYGPAPLTRSAGTTILDYGRLIPMKQSSLPFGIWSTFTIVNGRVTVMQRVSGV